jgi:hypothetical protein
MYATWPLVFSALVSGFIGGFLLPDRPQSQPVAAVTVSTGPELKSDAAASSQPAGRVVSKKYHALAASEDRPSATSTNDAQQSPCAIDSWPYHAPGCLDRAAAVESEYSVIDVKRVDPAQSLEAEGNIARERAAKAQQKEVSDRSERAEEADDRQRADDAPKEPAKAKPRPQARPERRALPAGRGSADNRRGREDPNVVIRGPDGRLYLAPRYRHVPPPGYYIR